MLMLGLSLGCSAAGLLQRTVATPAPTRVPAPTYTPTANTILPRIIVTPPADGKPGVIIIPPGADPSSLLPQTPTPTPTLTPTLDALKPTVDQTAPPATATLLLLPTDTPMPTATPLPTMTPTPFIVVDSGLVTLRTGPGIEYPVLAQLGPQIPIAIIGQNPEGSWYQLCCVSGEPVWVARTHVHVHSDPTSVPIFLNVEPPPPPTPTNLPTETPTLTPTPVATLLPFDRVLGPQFIPTDNRFLTILVKVYVGTAPAETPLPGYFLKVQFQNVDRPSSTGDRPSVALFSPVGAQRPVTGYANTFYNLKYEYFPPQPAPVEGIPTPLPEQMIGTGTWSVFLTDAAGNRLSDIVTFITEPNNPNREIYIAWVRAR